MTDQRTIPDRRREPRGGRRTTDTYGPCPVEGCQNQLPRPDSKTCSRACAIKAGLYRSACLKAAKASALNRLKGVMAEHGWTMEEARIYLDGWKAGTKAAIERARRLRSDRAA